MSPWKIFMVWKFVLLIAGQIIYHSSGTILNSRSANLPTTPATYRKVVIYYPLWKFLEDLVSNRNTLSRENVGGGNLAKKKLKSEKSDFGEKEKRQQLLKTTRFN